jgi:hypothetical protein
MIHCAATRIIPPDGCHIGGDSWVHSPCRRDMFRGIVPSALSDRFVSVAQNSVGGCGQLMGLHLGQEDGAKMRTVEAEHKPIKPETTLETRQGFHAVGGDHAAVV